VLPSRVREALNELQQYLSDSLPPLMVYDSVKVLMKYDRPLVANQINGWAEAQQVRMATVPLSDLLYHALRKLHLIGELKLLPLQPLAIFLEELGPHLEAAIPEEDRAFFRENLARLAQVDSLLSSPVDSIYRQLGSDGGQLARPAGQTGAASHEIARSLKSFNILLERIKSEKATTGTVPGGAVPAGEKELASQLLATAATGARNAKELDGYLNQLRQVGVDTRMDQLFRTLGRSLPDWAKPYFQGQEERAFATGEVSAMRRVVEMADDPAEAAHRFREMVHAALEQVNEGALARGVVMLDLAERLRERENLDKTSVEAVRNSAHQQLDVERLKTYLERPDKRGLLKRLLSFFPTYQPVGLLKSLRAEKKRDTRRLLIAFLEVHGPEARSTAQEQLESAVLSADDTEWYFLRNLVYLLRHIQRPPDVPFEPEIVCLEKLTDIRQTPPLIKEAIANLGAIRHERAEQVLTGRLKLYEKLLTNPGERKWQSPADVKTLIDRCLAALARMGTPGGPRAVVDYALRAKPEPALGDTVPMLAHLSGQDLSGTPRVVERLVKELKERVPFKVLGMTLKIRNEDLMPYIEALNATPLPQVQTLLGDIARKVPGEAAGQAAAKAVAAMEAAKPAGDGPTASLSGDLDVFGLPTLIQTLDQNQATGVLTLRTRDGQAVASISVENGKLRGCRYGQLKGVEAFFQLLEKPLAAGFSFVKQALAGEDAKATGRELLPLLFEGMTRYDELKRAATLVADTATFRGTDVKPSPFVEEEDPKFAHDVWRRAITGATALEVESLLRTDAFRVRRLYAHWMQEGALAPV